jgi:protocatechuate 3,4-dioxygenase, alpha subunit
VPAERRETLMAKPDANNPAHFRFDIRIQGPAETIFFDA